MHRLRALLTLKHQTKRACRPLARNCSILSMSSKPVPSPRSLLSLKPCRPGENLSPPCGASPKTMASPKASIANSNSSNAVLTALKTSPTTAFALSLNAVNNPKKLPHRSRSARSPRGWEGSISAPGGARTHNLQLRRLSLYPIELRVRRRRGSRNPKSESSGQSLILGDFADGLGL